jgi:hypothetical protein
VVEVPFNSSPERFLIGNGLFEAELADLAGFEVGRPVKLGNTSCRDGEVNPRYGCSQIGNVRDRFGDAEGDVP